MAAENGTRVMYTDSADCVAMYKVINQTAEDQVPGSGPRAVYAYVLQQMKQVSLPHGMTTWEKKQE